MPLECFFAILLVSVAAFLNTGLHSPSPPLGASCLPHHLSKNIVCSILYFGGISGVSSAYPTVTTAWTSTCSGRLQSLLISSSSKAPTQHDPRPRECAVSSMFSIAAAIPCTMYIL